MRAIVTVVGLDQVGIISYVCRLLSDENINILDISQTVFQEYFTMLMLVDLSGCGIPFSKISEALEKAGTVRGLSIRILREDIFQAMHRI